MSTNNNLSPENIVTELLELLEGRCPKCKAADLHSASLGGEEAISCCECDYIVTRKSLKQRASLPSETSSRQWQPIATAPKDSEVLIAGGRGFYGDYPPSPLVGVVTCTLHNGVWEDEHRDTVYEPLYWMPIPAAPPQSALETERSKASESWKCSICGTSNPTDVDHCRQCEYSRTVMWYGEIVPRDGRR